MKNVKPKLWQKSDCIIYKTYDYIIFIQNLIMNRKYIWKDVIISKIIIYTINSYFAFDLLLQIDICNIPIISVCSFKLNGNILIYIWYLVYKLITWHLTRYPLFIELKLKIKHF